LGAIQDSVSVLEARLNCAKLSSKASCLELSSISGPPSHYGRGWVPRFVRVARFVSGSEHHELTFPFRFPLEGDCVGPDNMILVGMLSVTGRCFKSVREIPFATARSNEAFFLHVVSTAESGLISSREESSAIPYISDNVQKKPFRDEFPYLVRRVSAFSRLLKKGIGTAWNNFPLKKFMRGNVCRFAVSPTRNFLPQTESYSEVAGHDCGPTPTVIREGQSEFEGSLVVHVGRQIINHSKSSDPDFRTDVFLDRYVEQSGLQKRNSRSYYADCYEQKSISGEPSGIVGEPSVKTQLFALLILVFSILIGSYGLAEFWTGDAARRGLAILLLGIVVAIWAFGCAGGLWTWGLEWIGLCASCGA
jgi:hypothetical protein